MPAGQKGLSELGSGAGEVQGEEHWLQIGRLSLIVLLELEIRLRVHTCKLEKPSDSGYTHTHVQHNSWDVGVFSTHTHRHPNQKPYKSKL